MGCTDNAAVQTKCDTISSEKEERITTWQCNKSVHCFAVAVVATLLARFATWQLAHTGHTHSVPNGDNDHKVACAAAAAAAKVGAGKGHQTFSFGGGGSCLTNGSQMSVPITMAMGTQSHICAPFPLSLHYLRNK